MPFLHWFKKKSANTEAEAHAVPAQNFATVPPTAPETGSAPVEQEARPASIEPVPTDLELSQPDLPVDSEIAKGEIDGTPAIPSLSVAIGTFYAKLPAHLIAPKIPDMARFVQIAQEDVVLDEETEEATLPLSILSLSCPEIFIHAVDRADDVPITFSIARPKDLAPPVCEPARSHAEEAEAPFPPAEDARVASVDGAGKTEIKLRLAPILIDFPPQLEPAAIHSLVDTQAEIALPLGRILSQLAEGRVVVSAEMFSEALPSDLKPYFETIDPAAEIPIPLQEIFARLPPSAITLREDQEVDHSDESIPTPFTEQADEDAKRFAQFPVEATVAAEEAPEAKDEPLRIALASDSERLQAIFLTDEPLDLAKTIQNVAALPGLRSCLLSTTAGLKLAGKFEDPGQEEAISAVLPGLFDWAGSKLEALQAGPLETITFYYGLRQLSTFVEGNLCLTVLHDNRPFKPGVREKIRAVMNELATLSASAKPV